jgi:type II secretory pathway pseudopilin PulG
MIKPLAVKSNTRGDTIVEVLIAISVIGFVLMQSFSLTSRNVNSGQDTQEREQAAKVVEGQIETLRTAAATDADLIFGSAAGDRFCLYLDGGTIKEILSQMPSRP